MKLAISTVVLTAIIAIIGLAVGAVAHAQGYYGTPGSIGYLGPVPQIESRANVFGGRDYYQGGQTIGTTRSNVFGGRDFYSPSGVHQGSTRGNVFGGETFYQY